MAKHLSKDSQITVGSSVALGQVKSWDTDESDTQVDVTDYDSTFREFVNLGLADRNFNAEVHYDLADAGQDEIRSAFEGAATAIVIFPEGNTSGKPSLTGTILVGSLSVSSSDVDSAIVATFSGKLSSLTEGTVP